MLYERRKSEKQSSLEEEVVVTHDQPPEIAAFRPIINR
jgi:hypothetical protein